LNGESLGGTSHLNTFLHITHLLEERPLFRNLRAVIVYIISCDSQRIRIFSLRSTVASCSVANQTNSRETSDYRDNGCRFRGGEVWRVFEVGFGRNIDRRQSVHCRNAKAEVCRLRNQPHFFFPSSLTTLLTVNPSNNRCHYFTCDLSHHLTHQLPFNGAVACVRCCPLAGCGHRDITRLLPSMSQRPKPQTPEFKHFQILGNHHPAQLIVNHRRELI